MLIGRDCAQAQKHLQTVSSEDKHQLAIQTPLGWTIVGRPAQTTRPLPIRQPHASTSAPTAMPKPSYASVLKTQTEDTNPMPLAQHYLQDDDLTAIAIQSTKEDELDGYSNDDRAFLNQIVPNI